MEDFVARPAPVRIALLVAGSLGFVLLGAWLAGLLGPIDLTGVRGAAWARPVGWLGMAFFGLTGVIGLRRLFEREDVLRIGQSGIWYRHWSNDLIPWPAIVGVSVWEHQRQKVVVLKLQDPARFPSSTLAGKLAAANRALTGGDISISLTGTDRSVDETLAAIALYDQ